MTVAGRDIRSTVFFILRRSQGARFRFSVAKQPQPAGSPGEAAAQRAERVVGRMVLSLRCARGFPHFAALPLALDRLLAAPRMTVCWLREEVRSRGIVPGPVPGTMRSRLRFSRYCSIQYWYIFG